MRNEISVEEAQKIMDKWAKQGKVIPVDGYTRPVAGIRAVNERNAKKVLMALGYQYVETIKVHKKPTAFDRYPTGLEKVVVYRQYRQ